MLVITSGVEPCVVPLLTNIQAARAFTAAVPPVVLLVFIHELVAALKFSFKSVAAVDEFDVAVDVSPNASEQTVVAEGVAVTAVGTGYTFTTCEAVAVHPPELVTVTLYVPLVLNVFVALVVAEPPLHKYDVPPLAVNVTRPQFVAVPEIAAVGLDEVDMIAVLFAEIVEVQFTEPLVDAICDIVMVVEPVLLKEEVEKVAVPAVVTVTATTVLVAVFEPDKL